MMWLRLLVAAAVLLMAPSSAFAWLLGKAAHVLAETTNTAESYSPADGTDTIIPRGGKTPGRLNSSSQQMRPRRPDCESAAHGKGGAIATRGLINPRNVRFTQSSIRQTLSTGENINDVAAALRGPGGDALASGFKPIRIFEKGGLTYTLDNRRLAIFSSAGRDVPFVRATPQEVAAEAWKFTATVEQQSGWFIRVK